MKKLHFLLFANFLFATLIATAQEIEVWVSDAGGFNNPPWFVYKSDFNGDNLTEVMNQSDQIKWPEDIVFLEDENIVLISNITSTAPAAGYISKHDIDTGVFLGYFAENLSGPTRMEIGPDGYLYVLQWGNTDNRVLRFDLDGTFIDEFTAVGITQSIGLDWDASGNLYVSSYGGSKIFKFDTTGAYQGEFINSGLAGPTNIFFDKSGNGDLIVFNWNSGIIKRFDSDGNFVENLVTGVSQCEGVDFMPNGDILVGVGSDGSVRRYDSDFNFIENFIEGGTIFTPNAVVIREVPLYVPENELDKNFINPTFGNRFSVIPSEINTIEKIIVFNSLGKKVAEINNNENLFWDASNYSEGVYFIRVISENGGSKTQKVIVKN